MDGSLAAELAVVVDGIPSLWIVSSSKPDACPDLAVSGEDEPIAVLNFHLGIDVAAAFRHGHLVV
jgi:hypothetical protein